MLLLHAVSLPGYGHFVFFQSRDWIHAEPTRERRVIFKYSLLALGREALGSWCLVFSRVPVGRVFLPPLRSRGGRSPVTGSSERVVQSSLVAEPGRRLFHSTALRVSRDAAPPPARPWHRALSSLEEGVYHAAGWLPALLRSHIFTSSLSPPSPECPCPVGVGLGWVRREFIENTGPCSPHPPPRPAPTVCGHLLHSPVTLGREGRHAAGGEDTHTSLFS